MTKKKTYQHFNFEQRLDIQAGVKAGRSITNIAKDLGRSSASIAREIKRNRIDEGRGFQPNRTRNDCLFRFDCQVKGLCGDCNTRRCANCKKRRCASRCKDYHKDICKKTVAAPFVCNGCRKYQRCEQKRYTYDAKIAQAKADKRLVKSREGVNMKEDDFKKIIDKVWPLIAVQGQSPAEVWMTHKDTLTISERTFYRYVGLGAFGMSKVHMPKAAAYKPRKRHKRLSAAEMKDRTYTDFNKLDAEVQASAVEMDTVIGLAQDTKVLLTLFFRGIRMLFIFVLPNLSPTSVLGVFDYLEQQLGTEKFKQLFGVILTDRGIEFLRFEDLEKSCLIKDRRCHLYYADPCRADQKGAIENAHLFIRRILPKKTSFEGLDAYKAALLSSHINSVPRQSLGGLCPLDFASQIFPRDFLEELGIEKVSPDCVILKPALLKKA